MSFLPRALYLDVYPGLPTYFIIVSCHTYVGYICMVVMVTSYVLNIHSVSALRMYNNVCIGLVILYVKKNYYVAI